MTLSFNKRELLMLTLAGTLALAACGDNGSDLGPANNPNSPVTLSSIVKSVSTMQTTDTAVPLEINALNIDTDSSDTALPNSDPNYSSLLGA